jgi:hypothetical protein
MEYHRARLQYQFNKLQPIRDGIFPAYGGNIEFELFSFFEVCYHLKDWVKHSPSYASLSNVEDYISQSPALRICADVCNKLKHRKLDRKLRSGLEPGVFMITSTMTVGPIGTTSIVSIDEARIETERGDECCFELAQECMEAWKTYFILNNVT